MPETTKEIHSPRGLARLLWRAPIWLYRLGLGGLLGQRFVYLTHTGRKSGQPRHTVLEVIDHDKTTGAYFVASGFGDKSDWYRNVMANPQVNIQVGRKHMPARAERLPEASAEKELLSYNQRYPTLIRILARVIGYKLNGTEEDVRGLAHFIPIVAFYPEQPR